jgi:hypothetical protein
MAERSVVSDMDWQRLAGLAQGRPPKAAQVASLVERVRTKARSGQSITKVAARGIDSVPNRARPRNYTTRTGACQPICRLPADWRGWALAAVAVLALLMFSACSGDSASEEGGGTRASTVATTGGETAPEATTGVVTTPPDDVSADDFDAAFFDPERSFIVENEWFPLEPGTRYVHRGWTEEDGERIPHSIVFTVTDLVKEINGIRAVVGWDRDFSEGELVESELIFFAQDTAGNVWHLGQYRENYDEEGELDGGRAWMVGALDGARAGIAMKAKPRLGAPAYSQGFAPAPYFWDDWSRVYKVDQKTCVPMDCYEDVLVIDEFEPTKPGAHQLKYYARGAGNVRTGWRGSDPEKEVLVLSKITRLSAEEMAEVREEAFALEARAYVYARTAPAEPRPAEGSSE